ncbi:hypothetical protein [Azospirillum endophyticum]
MRGARGGTFEEIMRCIPLTPTLSPGGRGGYLRVWGEVRHTKPNVMEQTQNTLALA